MKINELAKRLDVTPRAIRFYEEKGLLQPEYEENGYRRYTEDDAWRLQTIAAFREIGFGIEEFPSCFIMRIAVTGRRTGIIWSFSVPYCSISGWSGSSCLLQWTS
ncbi:MerR family transcriptional regulator [Paenibacillus sp. UNC451MF]|uniref:MerR family transcriptional regulator n=1 Tax=Paenibacillus sp. UNC451MF TaxID=1449063 RepID=UPI00068FC25E|nr:MerR family transcriptional regulator [Paenibacillus sp. UNC451MF]